LRPLVYKNSKFTLKEPDSVVLFFALPSDSRERSRGIFPRTATAGRRSYTATAKSEKREEYFLFVIE
jgi:hypothetical protein